MERRERVQPHESCPADALGPGTPAPVLSPVPREVGFVCTGQRDRDANEARFWLGFA